ncbi:FAD:protein FMN transferase [uncultured Gilliamella sp.]|uniref:FAD:protein FMN transferase n=1 Tax=uncultured Gilliamella sp. TaxID=1193505 RepID=UPI0025F0482E|nr:FAD:protein FMN transferase [uncultured Gilliamella sp.]
MKDAKRLLNLMGTKIQIWLQHDLAEKLLNEAEKRLIDYEHRFSANSPTSELMQVNLCAGIKPVQLQTDLFTLIKIGKNQSLVKNSFLNIAIGPLIQAWRIGFNDARYPTGSEIKQLLTLINPNDIIIDEIKQTVFLQHQAMAIDLGAIAKGYFADEIIQLFKQHQAKSAFIDLGGNVLTFGDCPFHDDGYWRVGIQNPFLTRGNIVTVLKIKNQSVVTSGIYERTFNYNGKTYHHIFDSQTGYPVSTDIQSITIVSKQSIDGEIWTTQLYGCSAKQAVNMINKIPGLEGIVITTNHEIAYSNGLSN